MLRGLPRVVRCNISTPSVESRMSLLSRHAACDNKDCHCEKEKHRYRCKMPRLIQSEGLVRNRPRQLRFEMFSA